MVTRLDIENFLSQSEGHPLIDVRTPTEYVHGHIPDAINLPLFSDDERAAVGTAYKQKGREAAMIIGLDHYGKNMQRILSDLKKISDDKQLYVHCWRGGMRSGVVSWMLDLFGYKVFTLNKGYKAFRRYVLDSFSVPKKITILGGRTGAAKTSTLHELKKQGEQLIDLEALAHHKGSAFGDLGEPPSPTQEQFENDLCIEFRKTDTARNSWLEDESQRIGLVNLPNALWTQMRSADVFYLDIPFEERLKNLVEAYGKFDEEGLGSSALRIQKRLGGLNTKMVLQFLEEKNFEQAFSILLRYYDKMYDKATLQRNQATILKIQSDTVDAGMNTALILNSIKIER